MKDESSWRRTPNGGVHYNHLGVQWMLEAAKRFQERTVL